MAKRNKTKKLFKSNLKLEALEQRQLLAGITGSGTELTPGGSGADKFIVAPNNNHYDQVLLTGTSVSVTNDVGNITRVSFLDLQGDIVQAEFGGAGTLTVSLDTNTAVANVDPSTKYNQTINVTAADGTKITGYEQGLASFSIQGSDATTNFTVFSVGAGTAFAGNTLFDSTHTGGNHTADVQRLTIVANPSNPNGSTFGGIRMGNAIFGAASGVVGISAANVQVQDVVTVGDIKATGTATPTLIFGTQSQFVNVTIAGGGLVEANGASINDTGSYKFGLTFADGADSTVSPGGTANQPAQTAPAGLSFTDNNPIAAQVKTFTLTTGVDAITGTAGTDVINGQIGSGASDTLTALDNVDGGAGIDTLVINDLAGSTALPGGITVKNVEVLNFASVGAATINTSTGAFTGMTNVNVTNSTGADVITGSATQAMKVVDSAGTVTLHGGLTQTVTTAGGVAVDLGKGAISVTDTAQGVVNSTIDDGTTVNITATDAYVTATADGTKGKITIGGVTAPSGAVTVVVNPSGDPAAAPANTKAGAIAVTGGTTISVTQNAAQVAATAGAAGSTTTSNTLTEAAVTVTGNASTTAVTVNQTALTAAKTTNVAIAAVTETGDVTFSDLTVGQTVILGNAAAVSGFLTYTAPTGGATAKQVATAFANLDSRTGASFKSGPVTGANSNVVTFTSTASGNVGDLTNTGTGTAVPSNIVQGVASADAQAGVGGITPGVVTINDANLGLSTATISSATLSNYDNSTISSGKLATLTLAGGGGTLGITNASATTLDLNLNKASAPTDNTITNHVYTTVKVHTAVGDSTLTGIADIAATALTVDGSNKLTLTSAAGMTNLATVTVSGAAGFTQVGTNGASTFAATVKDINASAGTGAISVAINPAQTTYEGGSGTDTVTINTAAPSKAISGGAGTDLLVINVTDAVLSNPSTNANISGFETMGAGKLGSGNYDATGFTGLSEGAIGGAVTYSNVAAGVPLAITATTGAQTTYALKTDTTSDALAININGGSSTVTANTVVATGIETVTINSSGKGTNTITLDDATATSVTATGAQALTLTGKTTNAALTSVDASQMTKGFTYTAIGTLAQTVKGGSDKDTLSANATGGLSVNTNADVLSGGAGDDTLIANAGADNLTGGLGNDTFKIQNATATVNTYTTIVDASAGDMILLKDFGAETFAAGKITGLGDTAVFQDYANAVTQAGGDASTNAYVGWFQFLGNTYVVESMHKEATTPGFNNGVDLVVKLSGLVDLSTASMVTGNGVPEIIIR